MAAKALLEFVRFTFHPKASHANINRNYCCSMTRFTYHVIPLAGCWPTRCYQTTRAALHQDSSPDYTVRDYFQRLCLRADSCPEKSHYSRRGACSCQISYSGSLSNCHCFWPALSPLCLSCASSCYFEICSQIVYRIGPLCFCSWTGQSLWMSSPRRKT